MHEDGHPIGDRGTTTEQITLLYKMLADHRRRALLRCLRNTETPLAVSTLVTKLTQSDDREPSNRTTDTAITLHHIHLPKLADTGIIEYDQSDQQATYTAPPQVDALLEQMLVTVLPAGREPSPQEK
ncbi:hypothetical protein ACFFQF_28715 [Haladaptatus pallidirubidus]|uniref:DUF7344 domain-containing protein n=2 Tax=Haladaptatus pallidirubidus TaxID=1008152 RepID=A0AAV3UJL2_9EURY